MAKTNQNQNRPTPSAQPPAAAGAPQPGVDPAAVPQPGPPANPDDRPATHAKNKEQGPASGGSQEPNPPPAVPRPDGTNVGGNAIEAISLEDYIERTKASTVTMTSKRAFRVRTPDGTLVQFKEGPQEVPESLVDHYYVKAHGLEPYEGGSKKAGGKKEKDA